MEVRLVTAYSLIALMLVGAILAYLRLTKERRLRRRSYLRYEAARRERLDDIEADGRADPSL